MVEARVAVLVFASFGIDHLGLAEMEGSQRDS